MFPNRFHSLGFYVPKDPLKVTIFCKWASFDGGTIWGCEDTDKKILAFEKSCEGASKQKVEPTKQSGM